MIDPHMLYFLRQLLVMMVTHRLGIWSNDISYHYLNTNAFTA